MKESILLSEIPKSLIYIVDDNIQNVILLENLLNISGYQNTWSTTDPAELLEKLEKKQPDLLLLDLMMPHISGFDILNQLKGKRVDEGYFPIIVITADTNPQSRDLALSSGANDFLTKPFDLNEIKLRIKNKLVTKYLMDQLRSSNDHLEDIVAQRTEELEKAKGEAERNEQKFRLLFDANLDEINLFHIDEKGPGNFFESNSATEQVLGYSREELNTLNISDLDINMNPEYFKNNFEKLIQDGSVSFETIIRRKDGELRNVEVKAILIQLEGKNTVMNIYRDITERVKYVDALIQQNKILKEIAWTQSHIVRAPLARMMGVIHLMEDMNYTTYDPEVADFLKMILNSAHELDGIIREITDKSNQNQITPKF